MPNRDSNPFRPAGWTGALEANTRVTRDGSGPSGPVSAPNQTTLRVFDRLANYQLLRRLGGGGMAEVFLARALMAAGVEKVVAFKTARPEYGPDTRLGGMFLNEARVSTAFQHPNVIQVFDFGEASGRPYLAMEFLRGRDLTQVLARTAQSKKPVPIPVAVSIAIEVCRALEYVHDQCAPDGKPLNLVHRDVTPGNIIVSARGEVKLMDFGVAAAEGLAGTEGIVGKRIYSAPEQLEGGREPTPQWDVYGLGVTLRELVTLDHGGMPRPRASVLNRDVPPELDAVIGAATHADPNFRCPSASAMRKLLERVRDKLDAPGEIGGYIQGLFGADLQVEEYEDAQLLVKGRARASTGGLFGGGPLHALRRKIVSSRFYMDNRAVIAVAVGLGLLLAAGGAVAGYQARQQSHAMAAELSAADAAIAEGRWVGTAVGTAQTHLRRLEELSPNDPRALLRRQKLAQKLTALGDRALNRGDDAEALVHFETAVVLHDGATQARQRIDELQQKARELARQKMGGGP